MVEIFDILIACLFGVLCGAVTGIIPGVHVNTVGAFVFASSMYLLNFVSPECSCCIFDLNGYISFDD